MGVRSKVGEAQGRGRPVDILFDLDGTLVDPKSGLTRSIQYALGKLGHPVLPAEELLWMMGPPFRVSFPKLLGSGERVEEAIAHYRESSAIRPRSCQRLSAAWPTRTLIHAHGSWDARGSGRYRHVTAPAAAGRDAGGRRGPRG
jgi:haloacid dehalogenase-like hydrolase